MNVLILTPDAVGSTLLQRLLTVYMQLHQFDRPVINLHELTNGISKYFNPEFNRELLKKHWLNTTSSDSYYQSLPEITELLATVDHYKTARVAHYHIRQRQDSIADQVPFYRYLDDNFYVISCRRQNLFEHALSWSINSITKRLNVYSAQEKINTFFDLYSSKIQLPPQQLLGHLQRYRDYINWSEDHFSIATCFHYEQHLPNIERFILDLPVFAGQPERITWNQTFGQEFSDWNRCHYLNSDIGALAMQTPQQMLQITQQKPVGSTALAPATVRDYLPQVHQEYLQQHQEKYTQARDSINRMQELGILPTTIPIKKQTLAEKMFLISNIQECLDTYNNWAQGNSDIAQPMSMDDLQTQAQQEYRAWDPALALTTTAAESVRPPIAMS
jgi:hypothetical protein